MLGKSKVEGRFLRVHASGVPEAASFGSFRAGLGGDFAIGTAVQRIDPSMAYYGTGLPAQSAGAGAARVAGGVGRLVLSSAGWISHVEGQKGLEAVESLFGSRTQDESSASKVLRKLEFLHGGSRAATDAPSGDPTEKATKRKQVPLFKNLRYARLRCKRLRIGGVRNDATTETSTGLAVLGCPSHDRAGLHTTFLEGKGIGVPLLCTVGEDMQVMIKLVQHQHAGKPFAASGAGASADVASQGVGLQHVATLLGHTGSPRAVSSCALPDIPGGDSISTPLGLMITCGAAKEVVLWALTRAPSNPSEAGQQMMLPEFVAGARLVGYKSQLLAISDQTKPSDRLDPPVPDDTDKAVDGADQASDSKSETEADEDDIEIADQRITCSAIIPVQVQPMAGHAKAELFGIGFASCTSGQLLVFSAGPFGIQSSASPKLQLMCAVDLGQPLLSVKAMRASDSVSGRDFVVLCGGTGGVLFALRVSVTPGSDGSHRDVDRSDGSPGPKAVVRLLGSL